MARARWIDDNDNPALDQHVQQLKNFTDALADGRVDSAELERQEQSLAKAMRAVEAELSDAQHAKVTQMLAELVAYTTMRVLHDLTQARVRQAIR